MGRVVKTAFVTSQGFAYLAEVRNLETPVGAYSFSIASQWQGAKNPDAEQTTVQITLDRHGLGILRDLIDAELRS